MLFLQVSDTQALISVKTNDLPILRDAKGAYFA